MTFSRFSRKGWSLFSCLHREVRIGVLTVATLLSASPRLLAATGLSVEAMTQPLDEETVADTLALGEAAVTASRAPMAASVAARQVVTLSREDLAAAGITTINDALKLSAGVDVRQRGGFGIQTDISINGGTHDQLTILLNGVPLTNPQTGHLAADFPVNLSDVERIEILEGAASRVMGTQAFSGAINIVTRRLPFAEERGRMKSELGAALQGGMAGTVSGELRGAASWSRHWAASLSGSYQRSDGAVSNGDFKGGKGYARLCYQSSTFDFSLQSGVTANDFGANTFYSAAYPNQWEATRRYLLSVSGESKGRVHLQPQISWLRSTDHFQLIRSTSTGENFHRTDVFTAGLNAWTDWKLGRTAFGAEIREEAIYSTNLGRPLAEGQQVAVAGEKGKMYTKHDDRTNVSYFLEHNLVWRWLTLSPGLMAVRNNAIDSRFRLYPGVDLSVRPSAAWKLYASWNRSLRLPSFTDLWYKSVTQEGNAGLRPEESDAFRLGANFSHPIVSLRAKAYYQRGEHMIDWVMRSPDDIYHATAFSLDNYGLGLDAELRLQQWWGRKQPFERLTLSYAWGDQHRRKGEPYFKSNYALEYLRHKFTAHLTHRFASLPEVGASRAHRLLAALTAEWTLRVQQREGSYLVYEDLRPTATLRPYGHHALLDLRLRWTQPRYELFLDMTNLTGHRYFDLANVRQPGFFLMGGVKVNL